MTSKGNVYLFKPLTAIKVVKIPRSFTLHQPILATQYYHDKGLKRGWTFCTETLGKFTRSTRSKRKSAEILVADRAPSRIKKCSLQGYERSDNGIIILEKSNKTLWMSPDILHICYRVLLLVVSKTVFYIRTFSSNVSTMLYGLKPIPWNHAIAILTKT